MLTPELTDGFTRIAVLHREKRTSVSIDDVLFEALARKEGGAQEAIRWIRAAVADIERMQDQGVKLVAVRNAGLSRLIQRLATANVVQPVRGGVVESSPSCNKADPEPPSGQ